MLQNNPNIKNRYRKIVLSSFKHYLKDHPHMTSASRGGGEGFPYSDFFYILSEFLLFFFWHGRGSVEVESLDISADVICEWSLIREEKTARRKDFGRKNQICRNKSWSNIVCKKLAICSTSKVIKFENAKKFLRKKFEEEILWNFP